MTNLEELNTQIAKNIKVVRIACGLTQAEVSNLLGVTSQQVQKYEHGSDRISAGALWQLSISLGIGIEAFYPFSPSGEDYVLQGKKAINKIEKIRKILDN